MLHSYPFLVFTHLAAFAVGLGVMFIFLRKHSLPRHRKPKVSSPQVIDVSDIGDRFVNNSKFRELILDRDYGLVRTLIEYEELDYELDDSTWAEFPLEWLEIILGTIDISSLIRKRAFVELTSRPKNWQDAVYWYKRLLHLGANDGDGCLAKMFDRIASLAGNDAHKLEMWKQIEEATKDGKLPIHNTAELRIGILKKKISGGVSV